MAKKVVSSFLEVKGLVEKDVKSGMNAARDEVEEKLEDNVLGYYDIGNPVMYQRTGTLLEFLPLLFLVEEIILNLKQKWKKIFHIL